MTLKEQLATVSENELIHIGAASSFFFIGTKDELMESIDDISEYYMDLIYKYLMTARSRLNGIVSRRKALQTEPLKNARELKKIIADEKEAKERCVSTEEKYHFTKENPDLLKRNVVEYYNRIPILDDRGGVGIIIEGWEVGSSWYESEYNPVWFKSKHKRKENSDGQTEE